MRGRRAPNSQRMNAAERFEVRFEIRRIVAVNRRSWRSAQGGEPRRNRTFNPQIKSLLLCQLS